MKATVNVICYKSKKLANGEHPLMLRVSKDNKKKFQSLGISVHPQHWDFDKNRPSAECPNKELILKLILEKEAEYHNKVIELAAYQRDYTAASLLKPKDKIVLKTVKEFYEELIKSYVAKGKRGNSEVYRDSLNSLKRYKNEKLDFFFDEIDVDWLTGYESWLKAKGCMDTTISVLFRTLRSAYNKAVESNNVRKVENPFKKFKVSKFNTKTLKRAISKEDIKKVMNIDLVSQRPYMRLSRNIFIFSYLCGGMNFTDIASLKLGHIINNRLVYIRQKTQKRIAIPHRI